MCLDEASYAAISAALECSNRDIAKVKAVIADHAITQSSFAQLDPEFFDTHFSDQRTSRRLRYDRPDFEKLANNKHLTRHKLWMDYVASPCAAGESKYQYSQFCEHLRDYIRATGMTSIIEHEPGQELYVDWAGDKVRIIDQATGEVGMKACLFVAVCPYSSLLFVVATANEKMDAWIDCHVKALNYLGKRPGIIVFDNAPTATYRPTKNKPARRIQQRYADFAAYYDILLVPARPENPAIKPQLSVPSNLSTRVSLAISMGLSSIALKSSTKRSLSASKTATQPCPMRMGLLVVSCLTSMKRP